MLRRPVVLLKFLDGLPDDIRANVRAHRKRIRFKPVQRKVARDFRAGELFVRVRDLV